MGNPYCAGVISLCQLSHAGKRPYAQFSHLFFAEGLLLFGQNGHMCPLAAETLSRFKGLTLHSVTDMRGIQRWGESLWIGKGSAIRMTLFPTTSKQECLIQEYAAHGNKGLHPASLLVRLRLQRYYILSIQANAFSLAITTLTIATGLLSTQDCKESSRFIAICRTRREWLKLPYIKGIWQHLPADSLS